MNKMQVFCDCLACNYLVNPPLTVYQELTVMYFACMFTVVMVALAHAVDISGCLGIGSQSRQTGSDN